MIIDLLFQVAQSMAKSNKWNIPSYNTSFDSVDSFVEWMIENNPERKEEIREKLEQFKKLSL